MLPFDVRLYGHFEILSLCHLIEIIHLDLSHMSPIQLQHFPFLKHDLLKHPLSSQPNHLSCLIPDSLILSHIFHKMHSIKVKFQLFLCDLISCLGGHSVG